MTRNRSAERLYLAKLRRGVFAGRKEKNEILAMIRANVAEFVETSGKEMTVDELEQEFGTADQISLSILGDEASVKALKRRTLAFRAATAAVIIVLVSSLFIHFFVDYQNQKAIEVGYIIEMPSIDLDKPFDSKEEFDEFIQQLPEYDGSVATY